MRLARWPRELEVDGESVMEMFTSETKLNILPTYLKPGFAFGGSCVPKDVRALNYRGKELDAEVLQTGNRKIGMLGLSFKAADDLRESPQVQLIKRLLGEGREIRIWDDNVSLGRLIGSNREYIEQVIPHIGSLLKPNPEEVLRDAEVVVIGTRGLDIDVFAKEHSERSSRYRSGQSGENAPSSVYGG